MTAKGTQIGAQRFADPHGNVSHLAAVEIHLARCESARLRAVSIGRRCCGRPPYILGRRNSVGGDGRQGHRPRRQAATWTSRSGTPASRTAIIKLLQATATPSPPFRTGRRIPWTSPAANTVQLRRRRPQPRAAPLAQIAEPRCRSGLNRPSAGGSNIALCLGWQMPTKKWHLPGKTLSF